VRTEAFEQVYRAERARLARSVSRMVGSDRAEDVIHDAFLAYARHADRVEVPEAWLSRVTRNRALEDLRRREDPLPEDVASAATVPGVERAATAEVVAAALEDIDRRSREALRRRFYDEQPYDRIAEGLGTSVAQAHVIVHRATRRLGRAIVRRLASVHEASGCVPALESLLGMREQDDEHTGCDRCGPVLDELAVLRGFGVLPVPAGILAMIRRAFGDAAARAAPVVEPAIHLAPALAALGLVLATLTPAAPAPAAAEPASPRSPVAARAAVAPPATAARAQAPGIPTSEQLSPAPGPSTVAEVGDVTIADDDDETQGIVDGDVVIAGIVLCRPLEPCPRAPGAEER